MTPKLKVGALFGVLAVLVGAGAGWAQTTGTIRGTVTDPSGAVVPGARVRAVLSGTNASRSAVANAEGDYSFPALAVGRYTVVVEAPGFAEFQQPDIEISVGRVVVVNAKLRLAQLAHDLAHFPQARDGGGRARASRLWALVRGRFHLPVQGEAYRIQEQSPRSRFPAASTSRPVG